MMKVRHNLIMQNIADKLCVVTFISSQAFYFINLEKQMNIWWKKKLNSDSIMGCDVSDEAKCCLDVNVFHETVK